MRFLWKTLKKYDKIADIVNQENKNINVGETDGRKQWEWKSRWDVDANKKINTEMFYLFFCFFIAILLTFFTWNNGLCYLLNVSVDKYTIFKKVMFYSLGGMLGGISFGMKYFYRVVARGWWHVDRRAWRYLMPALSSIIALIVGSLIEAGLMVTNATKPFNNFFILGVGFLAGYFADEAVSKMYEIANVIFGRSVTTKSNNEKK